MLHRFLSCPLIAPLISLTQYLAHFSPSSFAASVQADRNQATAVFISILISLIKPSLSQSLIITWWCLSFIIHSFYLLHCSAYVIISKPLATVEDQESGVQDFTSVIDKPARVGLYSYTHGLNWRPAQSVSVTYNTMMPHSKAKDVWLGGFQ